MSGNQQVDRQATQLIDVAAKAGDRTNFGCMNSGAKRRSQHRVTGLKNWCDLLADVLKAGRTDDPADDLLEANHSPLNPASDLRACERIQFSSKNIDTSGSRG